MGEQQGEKGYDRLYQPQHIQPTGLITRLHKFYGGVGFENDQKYKPEMERHNPTRVHPRNKRKIQKGKGNTDLCVREMSRAE